ncbi:MAG: rod shape-determining protein MreD [Bacteroidaceae bacterium]|nr:rod shape-determining protein MreD [Bacteroidaceae bacterium]
MERILTYAAWILGLTLVQVLVLNNIFLFGVATPFLYIYPILILNKHINHNILMLIAFAAGLLVDIFSNTPGVNAGAAVLIAYMRPGVLRMYAPREEFDDFEPSIHVLGPMPFLRYALTALLIHHAAVFLLEAFSLAHIGYLSLRIVCSTLLTTMLVMAIEFIRNRH